METEILSLQPVERSLYQQSGYMDLVVTLLLINNMVLGKWYNLLKSLRELCYLLLCGFFFPPVAWIASVKMISVPLMRYQG